MLAVKETTVHDMKTHFSQYASALLAGEFDEIVVKNRTVPMLRIVPYAREDAPGLRFGISKDRGHDVVGDDWDIHDGDNEIAEMFGEYL